MKIIKLVMFICLFQGTTLSQDSLYAVPKTTFNFMSIKEKSEDTLVILTCNKYVYSPFGKIGKKSDLRSSLLKTFKVASHHDKMENGVFEFHSLQMDSSRLILFFNEDKSGEGGSYIIKGQIKSSKVHFINNVRIGMDIFSFVNIFFVSYSNRIVHQYNTIIFESCLTGSIRHIYNFHNGLLKSVNFDSPSCIWNFKEVLLPNQQLKLTE